MARLTLPFLLTIASLVGSARVLQNTNSDTSTTTTTTTSTATTTNMKEGNLRGAVDTAIVGRADDG